MKFSLFWAFQQQLHDFFEQIFLFFVYQQTFIKIWIFVNNTLFV